MKNILYIYASIEYSREIKSHYLAKNLSWKGSVIMRDVKNFIKILLLLLFIINLSIADGIKWNSFEEGLKKAKREDKLILLDIYAEWCHWCNVMEKTTYSNEDVIKIINKYYIPIRVNAEKNPKINKLYNQGGLPSTVILNKNGEILWGGIYVSPEDMKEILLKFKSLSKSEIEKIAVNNKKLKERKIKRFLKKFKSKNLKKYYLKKAFRYIKLKFDYKYGGFKGAPKFPIKNLGYFLILYSYFVDSKAKGLLIKTLKGYSNLIDFEEGGIYRYGVFKDWSEPHYEKLLKDQAEISILYFNSYSVLEDENYKKFANLLIDFSKNRLLNKRIYLFYNSQGADILDENGKLILSGEDYFIYSRKKRQRIREKLGYSPNIEKSYYFSTNSLMVQALIYSYIFNNKKEDLTLAKKVLNNILKYGFTEKGIKYSLNDNFYTLDTQVYTLEALLLAYQVTNEDRYLKKAKELYEILNKYYYSEKLKIYTEIDENEININRISFKDNLIELNYRLSKALYTLGLLNFDNSFYKRANKIISVLPKRDYINTGLAHFLYFYPPLIVNIVGDVKNKEVYINNSIKQFPYWISIQFISNKDRKKLSKSGYKVTTQTTAYICNPKICFFSTDNLKDLKDKLKEIFNIYRKNL